MDILAQTLPTEPTSVVWSGGHAFVLDAAAGKARWIGVDDRGRRQALSCAELAERGFTRPSRS
jgi:hypothetical protein